MSEAFFNRLVVWWLLLAAAVFIALLFFAAPYGRHARRGWGPAVGSRAGWMLMEAASPQTFAACFLLGGRPATVTTIIFFVLWETHYIDRAFFYPFRLRGGGRVMPLAVVGFGLVFNLVNAYLNGRWVFSFSDAYNNAWLGDPRFLGGVLLFVTGFIINRRADADLRNLRPPGGAGYGIPQGRLFRWISCPNYLGEIMVWAGWAAATWSLPGLAFAVWTAANLVPRARAHHLWYRRQFADYPPGRKAILPGLF